jgi:hypothetical protein
LPVEIILIEDCNLGVVDNENGQFGLRTVQGV